MKRVLLNTAEAVNDNTLFYRTEVDGEQKYATSDTNATNKNILNDISKYKRSNFSPIEKENLQQFPECKLENGEISNAIITNTGLVVFKLSENSVVIYDILSDDNLQINDISFDLSTLKKYNEFKTPMNHFYVNYHLEPNKITFKGKCIYTQKGKYYYEFPADYLENLQPKENGLFEITTQNMENINTLEYRCCQGIMFKNLPNNVSINGRTILTDSENNHYQYVDLTNESIGEKVKLVFSYSGNETKDGIMEVIC